MAETMTEHEIAELRMAFSIFDKDGDGKINTEELGIGMRRLGQNLTEAELQDVVKQIGTDGEGGIEFSDLLALMMKNTMSSAVGELELFQQFKAFDRDGNGYISPQELHHVMANLGDDLTAKEIDEMVREADVDGDGRISWEEFKNLMMPE